jgi:hypothetical protein
MGTKGAYEATLAAFETSTLLMIRGEALDSVPVCRRFSWCLVSPAPEPTGYTGEGLLLWEWCDVLPMPCIV